MDFQYVLPKFIYLTLVNLNFFLNFINLDIFQYSDFIDNSIVMWSLILVGVILLLGIGYFYRMKKHRNVVNEINN